MVMKLRLALTSAVIVTVIGFQTIAAFGLRPGPIDQDPFLWPFLGYPMYSRVHHEGEAIPRLSVFAVRPDSSEVEVTPELLGTDFWIVAEGLAPAITDSDQEVLRGFADLFRERTGSRLIGYRLENRPVILTREGTTLGEPVTVGMAWLR